MRKPLHQEFLKTLPQLDLIDIASAVLTQNFNRTERHSIKVERNPLSLLESAWNARLLCLNSPSELRQGADEAECKCNNNKLKVNRRVLSASSGRKSTFSRSVLGVIVIAETRASNQIKRITVRDREEGSFTRS